MDSQNKMPDPVRFLLEDLIRTAAEHNIYIAGFAFGVERLLLVPNTLNQSLPHRLVYLITLGDAAKSAGIKILNQLRNAGISADMDYLDKSLKGAMRAANDAGAAFVLILGDDELKMGTISVKDMAKGMQKQVAIQNLIEELKC